MGGETPTGRGPTPPGPGGEGLNAVPGLPGLPRGAVIAVLSGLLLKLALLLLVHAVRPQGVVYVDTGTYVRPARALLASGTFSPRPEAAPEPEINRTPGYPLLIAAVYGLFGERSWLLSLVGVLASAGTGFVVASLAARFGGPGAATFAAALVSFEPGSFVRSLDLLSDTTFTFLLVVSLALLVRTVDRDRIGDALLAGLALALATHVRPISYFLVPLLSLGAGVGVARRTSAFRRGAVASLCVLLAPVVLLGGWQVRNGLRAGTFEFAPIGGSYLLFYQAAPVLARVEGRPLTEVQERLGNRERWWRQGGAEKESDVFPEAPYRSLYPETSRLPLTELSRRWSRQGAAVLAAHPVETARMVARGVCVLLLVPSNLILGVQHGLIRPTPEALRAWQEQDVRRLAAVLSGRHPAAAAVAGLLVLLNAALLVLAARGLFRVPFRGSGWAHFPLLAAFAYLALVSSGTESIDDRFRVPVVPLLAVYAGASLAPPREGTGTKPCLTLRRLTEVP